MIQYNSLNVKVPNSKFNNLKLRKTLFNFKSFVKSG